MHHPRRCCRNGSQLLLLGLVIILLWPASLTSHGFLHSWCIAPETQPHGQVQAVSGRRNIVSGIMILGVGLQAVPAHARMPSGKRQKLEESSLGLYRALEDIAQEILSVKAGGITGDQVRDFAKVQLLDRRLAERIQILGTLLPAACKPDPDTAPPQDRAITTFASLRGQLSGGLTSETLQKGVLYRLQLVEKQLLQFCVCMKRGAAIDGATEIVVASEETVIKEKGAKGIFPWKDIPKWSPADVVDDEPEKPPGP